MARARNPNRDIAKKMWLDSDKTMPLVEIASKLNCKPSQIRKWKSEDNWSDNGNSNVTNQKERYYSMKGNGNAKNNKGGAAPKGNQNARTHGLYSKYLPDDTIDIISMMDHQEPADLIWGQIQIQYAAIIRAQKIMWVENSEDETKVQTQVGFGDSGSDKYEYQFAWDKQANFLNAQSRAMSTLSGLIKQFIAIADEQDERKAKLNQIIASTDNIQARTALIKGAEKDTSLLNALIDVANGGDGSGSIGIQSETTRDDTATN
ncbi:TerS [Listeria monocytogenes]|uniref:phage terminase small subunit n=1 Tax=Listeria monocytogenes TaxID=1639 RepID=UPI0010B430FB|nr:TerS [Listeria monocytogenes]EAD9080193.1 TerS [Listeria monocytogenes]EAF5837933.1 TerS [Listeria monocytogenes]EAF6054853.1 TerS [Listeria monocytogenes]EHQ2072570.1 TerS [Listeria monocytogenes]